jgi:hypothetical protein
MLLFSLLRVWALEKLKLIAPTNKVRKNRFNGVLMNIQSNFFNGVL